MQRVTRAAAERTNLIDFPHTTQV